MLEKEVPLLRTHVRLLMTTEKNTAQEVSRRGKTLPFQGVRVRCFALMKAKSQRLLAMYHPGHSRSSTEGTRDERVLRYTVFLENLSKSLRLVQSSQDDVRWVTEQLCLRTCEHCKNHTACADLRVAIMPATARNIDHVLSKIFEATSWPVKKGKQSTSDPPRD